MAYNWNWEVFLQPSATGEGTYLTWLLEGLKWTVTLSLSSWMIALVVGSVIGVLRTVPNRWLSLIAATYVEIFRNIPLLVQLFIWYFVLPELLPPTMGDALKQMNPLAQQFFAAMICLGLFTAARVAEQVRSGINSLPRGQKNAGLAMGFTLAQVYRHAGGQRHPRLGQAAVRRLGRHSRDAADTDVDQQARFAAGRDRRAAVARAAGDARHGALARLRHRLAAGGLNRALAAHRQRQHGHLHR